MDLFSKEYSSFCILRCSAGNHQHSDMIHIHAHTRRALGQRVYPHISLQTTQHLNSVSFPARVQQGPSTFKHFLVGCSLPGVPLRFSVFIFSFPHLIPICDLHCYFPQLWLQKIPLNLFIFLKDFLFPFKKNQKKNHI